MMFCPAVETFTVALTHPDNTKPIYRSFIRLLTSCRGEASHYDKQNLICVQSIKRAGYRVPGAQLVVYSFTHFRFVSPWTLTKSHLEPTGGCWRLGSSLVTSFPSTLFLCFRWLCALSMCGFRLITGGCHAYWPFLYSVWDQWYVFLGLFLHVKNNYNLILFFFWVAIQYRGAKTRMQDTLSQIKAKYPDLSE